MALGLMFWHFTAFSGGSCIIPRGLELAPFSLAATGAGTDKLLRLNSRAFTSCESRHTHLSHSRETHCTLGVMAGDIPKVNFFLRHLNWCGLRGLEFSFLSNIPPANPGLSWSPRSPAYSWLALPSSPEPHLSASHCHHDNPLEARQEVATWTSLWKAVWQSPSLTPSFLCSLLTAICCLFKALAAFWTVCIANSTCLFSSLPPPPSPRTERFGAVLGFFAVKAASFTAKMMTQKVPLFLWSFWWLLLVYARVRVHVLHK